jgi:hypothetical protein
MFGNRALKGVLTPKGQNVKNCTVKSVITCIDHCILFDLEAVLRIPTRATGFSLLQNAQTGLEPTQPTIGTGGSFLGEGRPSTT